MSKSNERVFVELDQHNAHVVAAQLLFIGVFAQESVQHVL